MHAQWDDPSWMKQQFEALRAWLVRDAERAYQGFRGVDLGPPPTTAEFQERDADVRQALRALGADLRLRVDGVAKRLEDGRSCQIDDALAARYAAYYDSVVAPRIRADAAAATARVFDPAKPPHSGSSRSPVPYAVLATGSDGSVVERVFPGSQVHSSWHWAHAEFDNTDWIRNMRAEVKGSGKGWFSLGFPTCNDVTYVDVAWIFFWLPKYLQGETPSNVLADKKAYNWTCEPQIDFLGSVHVHAWDTWTTSKEAGACVSMSLQLVPIPILSISPSGVPVLANTVSLQKTILWECGQNIFKLVPLDNTYDIGCAVSPNPSERFKPHWIVVRARTWGWARGDGSHAVLDFDTANNSVFLKFMQVWEEDV